MEKIIYLDASGKTFNVALGSKLMALTDDQQMAVESLKNDSKVIELKKALQTPVNSEAQQSVDTPTFEPVKASDVDPINLIDPAVLQGTQSVDVQPVIDANSVIEPVINEPTYKPLNISDLAADNPNLNPVIDLGSQVASDGLSEPVKESLEPKTEMNSNLKDDYADNNEVMRGIMEINAERNKEIARLTKEIANVNALYDGKIISLFNSKKKIMNNNSQDAVMSNPTLSANDAAAAVPESTLAFAKPAQSATNELINLANQPVLNNDDFARTLKAS